MDQDLTTNSTKKRQCQDFNNPKFKTGKIQPGADESTEESDINTATSNLSEGALEFQCACCSSLTKTSDGVKEFCFNYSSTTTPILIPVVEVFELVFEFPFLITNGSGIIFTNSAQDIYLLCHRCTTIIKQLYILYKDLIQMLDNEGQILKKLKQQINTMLPMEVKKTNTNSNTTTKEAVTNPTFVSPSKEPLPIVNNEQEPKQLITPTTIERPSTQSNNNTSKALSTTTTMTKSGWITPLTSCSSTTTTTTSNPISKSIGLGLNRKRDQSASNLPNTSSSSSISSSSGDGSSKQKYPPTFVSNKSNSFKSLSTSSFAAKKKSLKQTTITKMLSNLQKPQVSWDFDEYNGEEDDRDSTYFKENVPITSEPQKPQSNKIPKLHQEPIITSVPSTTETTTLIDNSTTGSSNDSNKSAPSIFDESETFFTPTSSPEIICIDDVDKKTDDNDHDDPLMEEDENDDDQELASIFEKSQQSQHSSLSEQALSPSPSLLQGNKNKFLTIKARSGQDISLGEDTLELVANFNKRPREGTPSPTFKYRPDKAVRKKAERAKLPGFVCHECKEYYEARNLSPEETEKLINQCSKHRAKYAPRPPTPQDYWRTDFPSTEECIEKGYLNIEVPDPTIDPKIRNKIS